MSIETRLRETGPRGGGSGSGSSTSAGLATTGAFYLLTTANATLPNSLVAVPGTNINFSQSGSNLAINATTGVAAASGGLAGTGFFYAFHTSGAGLYPNSRVITAGSSVTVTTDATNIYISALTGSGAASNSGGLAGTGFFYMFHTSGTGLYPNSRVLTSGSSTTVRTDGTFVYVDANTTGGGASNTNIGSGGFLNLPVQSAKLYPNNSSALIDGGTGTWRLLFAANTQQYGVFQFTLPFDYSGSPAVQLIFGATSSIGAAKSVNWIIDQWGYGNSQSSIYIDSYAGANSTALALSAGYSAGLIQIITVPLATTNSFNAGNLIKIRVAASAGGIQEELVGLGLFYRAGTQTIATGSAGLVGTGGAAQLYTDITASRSFDSNFTNSSVTKSIMAMVCGRCVITLAAGSSFFQAFADNSATPITPVSGIVGLESGLLNEDNSFQLCFVVGTGQNYRVSSKTNNATLTLGKWFEFNI